MEGERYKKSPELVLQAVNHMPKMEAPCQFITWKRWDKLEEYDAPEVVVFFATRDILSGLFTLANFEEAEPNGVLAPFSSGCGSIVSYPYLGKRFRPSTRFPGHVRCLSSPLCPENHAHFCCAYEKVYQDGQEYG